MKNSVRVVSTAGQGRGDVRKKIIHLLHALYPNQNRRQLAWSIHTAKAVTVTFVNNTTQGEALEGKG